jgi:hypothetical protein
VRSDQADECSWAIPMWGRAADEVPPPWLVARIQSGELFVNGVGGLSTLDHFGSPGDIVVLKGDNIEFCKADEFNNS